MEVYVTFTTGFKHLGIWQVGRLVCCRCADQLSYFILLFMKKFRIDCAGSTAKLYSADFKRAYYLPIFIPLISANKSPECDTLELKVAPEKFRLTVLQPEFKLPQECVFSNFSSSVGTRQIYDCWCNETR